MAWTPEAIEKVAATFVRTWADTQFTILLTAPELTKAAKIEYPEWAGKFWNLTDCAVLCSRVDALAQEEFNRLPSRSNRGAHLRAGVPRAARKSSGTRVMWASGELDVLSAAVLAELRASPCDGLSVALVKKAMHKTLPPDRWRTFAALTMLPGDWLDGLRSKYWSIVEAGFNPPPPPPPVDRPVPVPVDADKFLRDLPLPKLAAVLAEREMAARLHFYQILPAAPPVAPALGGPAPRPPVRTSVSAERLASSGLTVDDLPALFPKVQMVGMRGHEDSFVRQHLARHPVTILQSIDPSVPANPQLLSDAADCFIVNTKTASQAWRVLVTDRVADTRKRKAERETVYGSERAKEAVKDVVAKWRTANPEAAALFDAHPNHASLA
jgi:hypothetical protein